MEYPKIALKGDGTRKTGIEVINNLISLGAKNDYNYEGYGYCYYFINSCGGISTKDNFPAGYKLVTLEQKQKLFKLI